MADTVVHMGENSPEFVALKLMDIVATIEGKKMIAGDPNSADKAYILKTYWDCLSAVRGVQPK